MKHCFRLLAVSVALAGYAWPACSEGAVYNLKIVTDASPDYSDVPSLIESATSRWETPEEKCWALFYWNHMARRQTSPMILHGMALTDPIRQFNDYGYTMCSTISGINCSLWDALGLKAKYWDISLHTVPEVEYGGRWHMYDNSMSALYTLCDGHTIAGVEDIGKPGACAASDWKTEPGHIARYHCLMGTSANGFLTGADTVRALDEEYRCFNPNGLKYRFYFFDWDRGHRYILNLREHESYTRHYRSLGDGPEFFVPNQGKDPEKANPRYRLRGNGVWRFRPALTASSLGKEGEDYRKITAVDPAGLAPAQLGEPGEVIFKIQGANVMTALRLRAAFHRESAADVNRIEVSTVNGRYWQTVWENDQTGEVSPDLKLISEVDGAYEVLVKVTLQAAESLSNSVLKEIEFEAATMLNSKTQPRLLLGKNTVYVGAGEPTQSIVYWPDLQGTNYEPYVVEEKNIVSAAKHPGYMGVMHAVKPNEEAFVVFGMDAPRDITRIRYGGRFYNRAPRSRIDLSHSFDGGRTWIPSYSLTNTNPPWDVIHYETVNRVARGTRTVLFKYALSSSAAGSDACSLYAVRMEADYRPADREFQPFDVTFNWSERQEDYSLVERSHTERIESLPHRYTIDVGGADHPVVNWMRMSAAGNRGESKAGYSDGVDVGGRKFVSHWETVGRNLALGRPYTVSVPSTTQWGSGDPEGRKLTDGVVGPPYAGGIAPRFALGWNKGNQPDITVDLGQPKSCGAFRIQVGAGWPWWDALKGEVKDRVELLTSMDGKNYASRGFFDLNLRWKDLPANFMWPDDEVLAAHNFALALEKPVQARFVRYKITPKRSLTVSEVQVLDWIREEPFDLRVALPDGR